MPSRLPVYRAGEYVYTAVVAEVAAQIASGAMLATGSKRRVTALVLIEEPKPEERRFPKTKPLSFREPLEHGRCWRHSPAALHWGAA